MPLPAKATISMAYIVAEPIPCFCTSGEASGVKLRDNTIKKQTERVQSMSYLCLATQAGTLYQLTRSFWVITI